MAGSDERWVAEERRGEVTRVALDLRGLLGAEADVEGAWPLEE